MDSESVVVVDAAEARARIGEVIGLLLFMLRQPGVRASASYSQYNEIAALISHPVVLDGIQYDGMDASKKLAPADQLCLLFAYELDGLTLEFVRLVYRTLCEAHDLNPDCGPDVVYHLDLIVLQHLQAQAAMAWMRGVAG